MSYSYLIYMYCIILLHHIKFILHNPQQMKTHVKEDCAMVRRTCRYQAVGCKFEVSGVTKYYAVNM